MTPADRIRWLAELSAERRDMRSAGMAPHYVGWFQTSKNRPPVYAAVHRKQKREPVLKSLFDGIVQAQGGRCYLCGKPMEKPTREHVMPRALGGRNAKNVLGAHSLCNRIKADRYPKPCELLFLAAINLRIAKVVNRGRA